MMSRKPSIQMRWSGLDPAQLQLVLATTSTKGPFSPRITLQIIGGKLLANVPYAFIGFDYELGTPVLEIIFPTNRLANIEIELGKLELHYESSQTLDSYIRLERCLRYSIAWRLPPAWNQIERKLVMGDKFLEEGKNYHWFVEFNLSASSKIVLTITNCGMIRLRPLLVESLFPEIRNDETKRLHLESQLSDGNIVVCEPFSCFVLPSLNRASVIAVAREPFGIIDTKQKMSSYWTGRYGYRLDRYLSTEGTFYCEVVFAEGTRFLYPHHCLKLDRGTVVHRHGSQHVVDDFRRHVSRILDDFTSASNVSDIIEFSPSLVKANGVLDEKCEQ